MLHSTQRMVAGVAMGLVLDDSSGEMKEVVLTGTASRPRTCLFFLNCSDEAFSVSDEGQASV